MLNWAAYFPRIKQAYISPSLNQLVVQVYLYLWSGNARKKSCQYGTVQCPLDKSFLVSNRQIWSYETEVNCAVDNFIPKINIFQIDSIRARQDAILSGCQLRVVMCPRSVATHDDCHATVGACRSNNRWSLSRHGSLLRHPRVPSPTRMITLTQLLREFLSFEYIPFPGRYFFIRGSSSRMMSMALNILLHRIFCSCGTIIN